MAAGPQLKAPTQIKAKGDQSNQNSPASHLDAFSPDMRGQIQSRNDYLDADMDDLTMLSDTPKAAKEDKPQYTDTET